MNNNSPRNNYSREFKLEAVKMSQQPDRTVAEVARELDLRENDLHNWRKMVKEQGAEVFPGQRLSSSMSVFEIIRPCPAFKCSL